jgi:hypothetical protein
MRRRRLKIERGKMKKMKNKIKKCEGKGED